VGVVDLAPPADGFAVGDLRRADVGGDLKLALHAVDDDLKVEFAHPFDDCLATFMVDGNPERGIFGGQALKCRGHLFLISLRARLNRDFDNRIGEFHPLQDDRLVRIAERIARGRAF